MKASAGHETDEAEQQNMKERLGKLHHVTVLLAEE
jgi:hypothetical protein